MKNKKIAFITGSTEGIGKATAIGLAKQGYHVVIHGRNEQKTNQALQEIQQKSGSSAVDSFVADLSSLQAVKKLADSFKQRYTTLDVLVNNAGLMKPERVVTVDGLESNFAVNYLAHFLLTNLLLEPLKRSESARVIGLTSSIYSGAKPDFNDLQAAKNYSMFGAYCNSKLFVLYFVRELASRLRDTNVSSFAVHPGVVNTSLARDMKGILKIVFAFFTKVIFVSPEKGAATSIYLATGNALTGKSGLYFENKKEIAVKGVGNNIENQKELWQRSESLVKKFM